MFPLIGSEVSGYKSIRVMKYLGKASANGRNVSMVEQCLGRKVSMVERSLVRERSQLNN